MDRVVLFGERLGTTAGGTEVYEASLISELLALADSAGTDTAIIPLLAYRQARSLLPARYRHLCRLVFPQGKIGTMLTAGLTANGMKPSVFHALFIRPPFLKRQVPVITTVHDLGFQEFPDHYPSSLVRKLNWNLKRTVNYPGTIVTVSEFTRQTLIRRTGIDQNRVVTVHNGMDHSLFHMRANPDTSFLEQYGIRQPYLLYAGRLQPRKNIKNLIRTFEILKAQNLFTGQLVLIGNNRAFLCDREQKHIDASPFRKDIIQTGHVPFNQVPLFLQCAHAFLFLSLYEGFGFPVIEAMACGTPVVCSNTTSLPEVAGSAAILVNPEMPEEAAAAVKRLDDNAFREKMIDRGLQQARKFTWKATAEKMLALYKDKACHKP